MAFTSWQALYQAMLNALAENANSVIEFRKDNLYLKYSSKKEIFENLDYVKTQADRESGRYVNRIKVRGSL